MYEKRIQELKQKLYVDQNFDVVSKAMLVQNIHMTLFFVDGFAKDEILEKMMEFLLKADIKETVEKDSVQVFCDRFISYLEVDVKADMKDLITAVLSGSIVLMVEGYEEGIVIDARTYPVRGMEEPQDDKVL
ncbi:MAG: spore germination protein, partial [Longicatena sp.]